MTTVLLLKLWYALLFKATLLLIVLLLAIAILPAGLAAMYREWRELKNQYPDSPDAHGILARL